MPIITDEDLVAISAARRRLQIASVALFDNLTQLKAGAGTGDKVPAQLHEMLQAYMALDRMPWSAATWLDIREALQGTYPDLLK